MARQPDLTVTEAAALLGTTKEKIARLVKQGVLTSRRGTIDARRRLIPREQVERLLQEEGPHAPRTPARSGLERPRTAAMYTGPLRVQSDEVEEFLEKHWPEP